MRSRAQDDVDYGDGSRLSTHVGVHLSASTTVEITTTPERGRATIEFSGNRHATHVTLFAGIAELRELRDILTDSLASLADTDRPDTGPDSPTEPAGGAAAVGDRAA